MSRTCPILKVLDYDGEDDLDKLVVSPGTLYSAQVSPIPPEDFETCEEAYTLVEDDKYIEEPKSEDNIKSECSAKNDRRSSLSWKGFNLKKQLSKVDMKLKQTFSSPPEKSGSSKRGSVFYSGSTLVSPAERESGENTPEVQNSPEGEDLPAIVLTKGPEREDKGGESASVVRPTDLQLFDAQGKPIAPPRKERKRVSVDQKTPNQRSDMRLLSVPNIKYTNQQGLRELRRKEGIKQTNHNNQPFGNVVRKISKFISFTKQLGTFFLSLFVFPIVVYWNVLCLVSGGFTVIIIFTFRR